MLKKFLVAILSILIAIFIPLVIRYDNSNTKHEWVASNPSAENMNSAIISKLIENLHQGMYGDIDSLLIIKNGKIVVEEYLNNYTQDSVHQLFSVTKSVTSSLMGIVIEQNKLINLNSKILDYFSEYKDIKNVDNKKKSITIKDVISMTSGLKGSEFASSYTNDNNIYNKMSRSKDWIKFALDLPMDGEPGKAFSYFSGNTMLLSAIIKKSTGMDTYKFAEKNLFKPLGITNFRWSKITNGLADTGGGLSLTPRDLAKIGQLYLNKGKWYGKQIVPEKWINDSTAVHMPNATLAGLNFAYGYGWWILPDNEHISVSQNPHIFAAIGYRGQFMFVIPDKNMIIVSTAGNSEEKFQSTIDFFYNAILKAAE